MKASLHARLCNHELWLKSPTAGERFMPCKENLSGLDLSIFNLTNAQFAHCTLENTKFGLIQHGWFLMCHGRPDFKTAELFGTSFEKCDGEFIAQLVGATWLGRPITKVTDWMLQDMFWVFRTNEFVQIGCMVKTLEEWTAICQSPETLRLALSSQPFLDIDAIFEWWQRSKLTIISSMS